MIHTLFQIVFLTSLYCLFSNFRKRLFSRLWLITCFYCILLLFGRALFSLLFCVYFAFVTWYLLDSSLHDFWSNSMTNTKHWIQQMKEGILFLKWHRSVLLQTVHESTKKCRPCGRHQLFHCLSVLEIDLYDL